MTEAATGCPQGGDVGDLTTSFFRAEQETVNCPYPAYTWLRDRDEPYYSEQLEAYVLARHEDISNVLLTRGHTSSRKPFGRVPVREEKASLMRSDPRDAELYEQLRPRRTPVLINADDPDHLRQRRVVSGVFTPRRVARQEDSIRAIAVALLEPLERLEQVDLVEAFAVPFPVTVIARLMGVPDDRIEQFKTWSDDYLRSFGNHGLPPHEIRALQQSQADLFEFLRSVIGDRRRVPTDDFFSAAVNAVGDDGKSIMTDDELVGMFGQFLVAGNETTTSLIASAGLMLATNEDLARRLDANRGLIPDFVEEVLRLESPAQTVFRYTLADIEVSNGTIPKGSYIALLYGAGNRDGVLKTDDTAQHLAFGAGLHYCVGAGLARLEGRVAVEEMLSRLAPFTVPQGFTPNYDRSFIKRALDHLPLQLHTAPAPSVSVAT